MEDLKKAEQQQMQEKSQNMYGGLIMIAVGVVFLVMQYSDIRFNNWWALFILIPALLAWSKAASLWKAAGRMNQGVTRTLAGSLFPLFIASIFLFNWDWGRIWPGFIILAGINALAGSWDKNIE